MATSPPRTALESLTRRRFLVSVWPWRSLGYLFTALPVMVAAAIPLVVLALPWLLAIRRGSEAAGESAGMLAVLLLLGAALIAVVGPAVSMPLAALERHRLALVDTRAAISGHRTPSAPGAWPWLRTRYGEAVTWRELAYALLLVTVGPVVYGAILVVLALVGGMISSPFLARAGQPPVAVGFGQVTSASQAVPYALAGLALLPVLPYLLALTAGVHAAVARGLLHGGSGQQLRAELTELSRSRARLADAFEAERRRIERDLHDGAQQRLVNLTIQLGLARLDLPPDSPAATAVAGAHEQAKHLMAELRELIHGIHPQVLTDLGLPAALSDLADQSPVPMDVRTELPGRLSDHLESTVYFVVAEALTNIAKHSGAGAASVAAVQHHDIVTVRISDNGRGGADPDRGSGLAGLADRVAVAGGTMKLSSPAGGPTVLHVELPCSQSEPPSE